MAVCDLPTPPMPCKACGTGVMAALPVCRASYRRWSSCSRPVNTRIGGRHMKPAFFPCSVPCVWRRHRRGHTGVVDGLVLNNNARHLTTRYGVHIRRTGHGRGWRGPALCLRRRGGRMDIDGIGVDLGFDVLLLLVVPRIGHARVCCPCPGHGSDSLRLPAPCLRQLQSSITITQTAC